MNKKQVIYLDNNATTPIDPRVLEAMMPFLTDNFANANSTHQFGKYVNASVKLARQQVSDLIGAEPNEIIFTSGATEAINHAIKGVAESFVHKGKHIVTVTTEHPAVLDSCKYLEKKGYDVTYLEVQPDGILDIESFKNAVREDTILVSVMHVNNETGVIQPIKEISSIAHSVNALFFSDCTQSIGKIPVDVDELGIDMLCLSGHKIYGPKGIGVLFLKKQRNLIEFPALIHGGGQENGLRSGTTNIPGIVALGAACNITMNEMHFDVEKFAKLRDFIEVSLIGTLDIFINGNIKNRVSNVTNICFPGLDSNVMIGRMKHVALSNGSACKSRIDEPSHVLTAMGLSNSDSFSSIRFSIGRFNQQHEIEEMLILLKREISNYI